MGNKEKQKAYNKDYYLANKEKIKADKKTYYRANVEKIKTDKKAYYLANTKKLNVYSNAYHIANAEKISTCEKAYYFANTEKIKVDKKAYYLANKERLSVYSKAYFQTPAGKQANRKVRAKRRQFGFIPLNDYFKGSEGHHIDRERVIYIPKELHKSISHSLWQNRNMEAINARALEFLKTNALQLFY